MRLLQPRLPREGRGGKQLAIDSADEFQSQPFLQLREVHAIEVAKKLYTPQAVLCLKASTRWGLFEKPETGIFRLSQSNFWFLSAIDRFWVTA